MPNDARFELVYAQLTESLQALRRESVRLAQEMARVDSNLAEVQRRVQIMDDARVIMTEAPSGPIPTHDEQIIVADTKNRVRESLLQLINRLPANQWLSAAVILDMLMAQGYEAPSNRNNAYASVYTTLGRLVADGLILETSGSRGKLFARLGSRPATIPDSFQYSDDEDRHREDKE